MNAHRLFSRLKTRTLLLSLTAALITGAAFGQATTGSISGHVTDPTGKVVQGASISIQNVDNGLVTTAVTDNSGDFTLSAMPPDHYKIIVEKGGFSDVTVPAFKLDIDQRARFNIPLKVGEVSTSITVTDLAPVLQVQGAETGQVIGSREIADLPTLGRDFSSLMLLVPGVVSGGGGNNLSISVNGQREFSNSYQVNGVEVSGLNNDTNVRPSPDAIQEFKVVTGSYAPEFGRASAGAVIIQTKSGTNNIHGSAFFFDRPTGSAANDNFAPKGSSPTLSQKNFGGTIGGPIKRDKAFLFLGYEGFKNTNGYSFEGQTIVGQNQVIFDPNGDVDLSKLLDPYTGNRVPIFDPYYYQTNFSALQYTGNIIPAAVVSPAGRLIVQKLFPAPQNGNPYGNFLESVHLKQGNNVGNLRGDYTFSQNNRFYLTYDAQQGYTSTSDPYAGAIPIPGGGGGDTGDLTAYENHSIALTYDHVFTQNLLNEVRGTYFLSPTTQKSLLDGTSLATQFGIKNANIPGFPDTFGFPQIFIGSGPVTGGSTFKPLTAREKIGGIYDSLTYTHGQHNIKVGYEYRHINSLSDYSLFGSPFEYFAGPGSNFTGDSNNCFYTYDPTCTYGGKNFSLPYGFYDSSAFYYNGGAEIADLLLGLPQVVDQGLQLTKPNTIANEHTFYAQDYWQVTRKLNLTYGLRYEYSQPFYEANNNQANFDMTTLQIKIAGRGTNSRSLVNSNKTDFMPRVGFAYQIRPTTVLRGGFGIFYSPENDSRDIILTENYPFYTQQSIDSSVYGITYQLDAGAPRATTISVPAATANVDFTTVPGAATQVVNSEPTNFPTANSKSYNLTIEQQLGTSTSIQVGFVGANTRDLSYKVGDYNVGGHLSSKIGKVEALLPVGLSNYSSMQAELNRRFTRGYSVLLAYTYSHSLDNGPAPRDLGRGGDYPQSPFNVASEYGNSDTDVRNNFVGSQVMELPFGKGKRFLANGGKLMNTLIGGWQLNSITTLHGGRPFNIQSNSGNPNFPGLRPNLTGDPYVAHRTKTEWFNPKAFTVPATQASKQTPGNLARNMLYGPSFTNEDLSLFKVIPLSHEMNLQIRAEAFNVLNTSRYGQPDGDLAHTKTFGMITGGFAGANQRIFQFAGRLTF
jgi:hypothetical protein